MIRMALVLSAAAIGCILAFGPVRAWTLFKHLWEEAGGHNVWGPDDQ